MKRIPMGIAGLALVMASTVGAQGVEPYTFRMLLRGDTITSEVVQRTVTTVNVDMIDRTTGARFQFGLAVAPDGRVTSMDNAAFVLARGDSAPVQRANLSFGADTVVVTISGNRTAVQRIATRPGALPYINPSFALIEQLTRRARAIGGAEDTVPLFFVSGGQTIPAVVDRIGDDSMAVHIGAAVIRAAVGADGALLGAVIPIQGVRVVRVAGAHPLVVRKVDYGPPPGAPYRAEEVTVHTPAGLSFTGTLTMPAMHDGPVPAVVTITGSGSEDRDERSPVLPGYRPFWQVADTLARRGIATLRLDDRGVNGSSPGPADGTSADYADDIRAALAYLRGRPDIDGARLGLVGHSEGGMIAPMVAATDPRLKGIVLMAGPAYTGGRVLAQQQQRAVDNARGLTPAQRTAALEASARATDSLAAHSAWLRFFIDHDPLPTARRVRVPVLILQGETDEQVSPEQSDTLAAAFRAGGDRDVSVRKFADTDHLFVADSIGDWAHYATLPSMAVRPEVLGAMADWLVTHLR